MHGCRQLHSLHKNRRHYVDIVKHVDARFHTSNYELERPLPRRENKKVIKLIKDGLSGKIMTESVALWPKTYNYLKDDKKRKQKAQKSVSWSKKLNFKIINIV